MKKLSTVLGPVFAGCLVMTLAACGGSSTANLPEPSGSPGPSYDDVINSAPVAAAADIPANSIMARIKARGTLIVGGTDATALFSLRDPVTNKLTGFDAGLSAMLARYIIGSPSTKLTLVTAATREALLQNGTVDTVFATYTITPARAQKVAFAGPYYSSGDAILVKADDISITTVGDLNGKTVCTESSSTAANDIKQYAPGAKIILFDQNAECEQAVVQGRADAYVLDQAILLGDVYRDASKVKVVGQPFTNEPYGIGLPLSAPEFKTFVDNWLKLIESDGEWAKLWRATVGTASGGIMPNPPAIGSVAGS